MFRPKKGLLTKELAKGEYYEDTLENFLKKKGLQSKTKPISMKESNRRTK